MDIKDTNGVPLHIGDKVTLPKIASAVFTIIMDSSKGVCLYTNANGLKAYVSLEEAKSYGMERA